MRGNAITMVLLCLAVAGCTVAEENQVVGAEDVPIMGPLVLRSATELTLDFYVATLVEDPTEEVPPGYQIIERDRVRLMAKTEPDLALTEKDIRTVRLTDARSYGEEGETIGGDYHFVLGLAKSAPEAFAQLTGDNVGSYVVIALNGDVVARPRIMARVGRGDLILPRSDMPEEHQKTLLAFSGQPPEIVPGTGKIIVKARFGDGAKPLGAKCGIKTYSPTKQFCMERQSEGQPLVPTVVGAYGDWTIYNVPEGAWSVWARGDDFAFIEANDCPVIQVNAAEEKLVNFTLTRGGSVTGRVIYADTGKPVSGKRVTAGLIGDYHSGTTDAEGHYIVKHIAPGRTTVRTQVQGFVLGRSEPFEVKDEATVMAPDIRLRRGGWISGYVVRPEDAHQGDSIEGRVRLRLEGQASSDAVVLSDMVWEDKDFRFRLGLLLPGLYTLEAQLDAWGKGKMRLKRWCGEVKGIRVEIGKVTKEVTIEVAGVED